MPPLARGGIFCESAFEKIERLAIRTVADRMDRDLIPFPHHSDQRICVEAILLAAGATVARPIGIIGEKLRAARPEGAIVEGLHGACHEHAIRSAGVGSAILPFRHHTIVSRGEHRVHADGQLMFRVEALERMHQLDVRSCLVNGDEPGPRHFPQACADSTLEIARRRRRNRAGQQTRRVVEKNARRLPLGAFSDFAPFRASACAFEPTNVMRPPLIATAWASGCHPPSVCGAFAAGRPSRSGSSHASVYTRPLTITTSAGAGANPANPTIVMSAARNAFTAIFYPCVAGSSSCLRVFVAD